MTILDCIESIPSVLEGILDTYPENMAPLEKALEGAPDRLDELVLIGSGTSDTSARTSQSITAFLSGLRTTVLWPAEMERILQTQKTRGARENNTNGLNPRALYVFTSQTGTSRLTADMMEKVQKAGALSVSITESPQTPLAQKSRIHLLMGCGREPFLMRTIGYVSSVLTHVLMGLRLGVLRGNISPQEEKSWLAMAREACENRRIITEQVKAYFPEIRGRLMESQEVIFTGQGAMYGICLEGAVKFWEMPQKPCIGLELEEGMHGPNYGYSHRQCVIYLCDGSETDPGKGVSLIRYMQEIHQNGLAVGAVSPELGLSLSLKGGLFSFIEMSAVPQVLAYLLTMAIGRDISKPLSHADMDAFFKTHQ